jgi:hypothetical protein
MDPVAVEICKTMGNYGLLVKREETTFPIACSAEEKIQFTKSLSGIDDSQSASK